MCVCVCVCVCVSVCVGVCVCVCVGENDRERPSILYQLLNHEPLQSLRLGSNYLYNTVTHDINFLKRERGIHSAIQKPLEQA